MKSRSGYRWAAAPVVLLALANPGFVTAQDADAEDALEEIVVTGSRIVRRDFVAPSPIVTIDRGMIETAPQPTIEETLNRLPQVTPNLNRSSNNPGNGQALLNLRGLGPDRNLVLLNGRRLAPAGTGSSFDLNNIPAALIDRVEVITGGAAATYGSDAIAGVVNFITRDDFEGLALETSGYITERGDSEAFDLNLAWGADLLDGQAHLVLFGGYYERGDSFASDRSFTRVPLRDTWEGEFEQSGSVSTPAGAVVFPQIDFGNGPAATTFGTDGTPREFVRPDDLYNFAPVNYLQTPLERYSVGILGSMAVADAAELYAELNFVQSDSARNLAPVPAAGQFAINTDNPVLSASNQQFFADNFFPLGPNLVGIVLRRRLEEIGPRITEFDREYGRAVVGLRGDIGASWDYDAWVSYTHSETRSRFLNDASTSRLQQGLLVNPATGECFDPTGGCVPINPFGAGAITDDAAAFLGYRPFNNLSDRTHMLVGGFIRGEPLELPAGPLSVVFGAEWRSDEGNFEADDALFTGDTLGYRGDASVSGRASVGEVYTEMLVPLLADVPLADYLAVELGYRYSDYDDAGPADTWKYGAEWAPVERLRFRAMAQRSIRAPNVQESFQEQIVEVSSFVGNDTRQDPCSASADPVGSGIVDKCVIQGIPRDQVGVYEATPFFPAELVSGGNASLTPEIADTLTLGAVLTLGDRWTISVDAFELEVEDTIGSAAARFVCFSPENVAGEDCDRIRRDPVTYNVVRVDNSNANFGRLKTRGTDVQVSFQSDVGGWLAPFSASADVSMNVVWTHLNEYSVKANAGDGQLECAGFFGWPCSEGTSGSYTWPEDRVLTTVNYAAGEMDLTLTWNWIGNSDNAAFQRSAQFGFPNPDFAAPDTGATSYLDLALGYRFTDQVAARLNIVNLLDEEPPILANAVTSNNTDTGMYDVFGRAYRLSLSLNF